jgi:uncharacterized protein with PIN domain
MGNPDENRLQLAVDWLDEFDPPPAKDVQDVNEIPAIEVEGHDSEALPRSLPAPSSRARRCEHCSGELVRSQRQKLDRLVSFGSGRRPYRCVDCRRRTWH